MICICLAQTDFLNTFVSVYFYQDPLTGTALEDQINTHLGYNQMDMFWMFFVGHGFGKGQGYLLGSVQVFRRGSTLWTTNLTYYSKAT